MPRTRAFAVALSFLAFACRHSEVTGPVDDRFLNPPTVAPSLAAAVSCGETIMVDVTVQNDLTCAGDALFVGADGVKVNLNGHTITGNGTGVGITVRGRSDVDIFGGTVRNFVTGIFISTSTGVVIKDNGFTQNREAVFLIASSGNVVKANTAWQNSSRGIMLRPNSSGVPSTDNTVMDNVLTANPSGILVFDQSGNTLKANIISGSTVAAIDLTGTVGGTGNVIKGNLLTTSAAGVKFGTGWTGNSFIGNTISENTCALRGAGAANTYKGNVLTSNVTDLCP